MHCKLNLMIMPKWSLKRSPRVNLDKFSKRARRSLPVSAFRLGYVRSTEHLIRKPVCLLRFEDTTVRRLSHKKLFYSTVFLHWLTTNLSESNAYRLKGVAVETKTPCLNRSSREPSLVLIQSLRST